MKLDWSTAANRLINGKSLGWLKLAVKRVSTAMGESEFSENLNSAGDVCRSEIGLSPCGAEQLPRDKSKMRGGPEQIFT